MGKIVKYCASCEESFAEKFGFCPNCGKPMEAFEMSPVPDNVKPAAEPKPMAELKPAAETAPLTNIVESAPVVNDNSPAETIEPEPFQTSANIKYPAAGDTQTFSTAGETKILTDPPVVKAAAPVTETVVEPKKFDDAKVENFNNSTVEYSAKDLKTIASATADADANKKAAAAAATVGAGVGGGEFADQYQTKNYNNKTTVSGQNPYNNGFNVTVIKERNGKQRNLLLLGAMLLMLTLTAGGMVYSIFNHPLLVGAIGDEDILTLVPEIDEVPMPVDPPEKKSPEKGGGGGGGGRNEETPTSKGRLATQTPDPPLITPTKTIPQKDNFDLKMIATTQGTKTIKPTDENYGDPSSKYLLGSDGKGKGGGQGSGEGTGQGSGRGTGQGSGLGSGSGGGNGNGNGNGTGSGDGGRDAPPPPPKPAPVGVTEKIKFISKPRAGYTDEARTNQIQGTVRVRVTFLPSGQIGSVAPVSGLPYGLTEQAIAAAKQIRFEPAKKNGVPVTSVAIVEYNFNIY